MALPNMGNSESQLAQVESSASAWRELLGRVLISIGWLLRVITFISIPYLADRDWSALILVPPLGLSAVLVRWGKRQRAPGAEEILGNDARPPVVFLRSFQDEEDDQGVKGFAKSLKTADRQLAQSTGAWGPYEQERLADVLKKVGPYVAIGKPGEALPELGAARMYVSDEEWKQHVIDLCSRSRLVILRAGMTNGLQWEVGQLVLLDKPTKLLLLLPSTPEQYQRFRAWANEVFPVPLPSEAPKGRLLIFDEHWASRVLPPKTTLTKSLEPYLRQNGLKIKESFWEAFVEHNNLRS